jgi:hypothetical protein
MERPDEVNLSRQDGEALIERLQSDALTVQDRCVLGVFAHPPKKVYSGDHAGVLAEVGCILACSKRPYVLDVSASYCIRASMPELTITRLVRSTFCEKRPPMAEWAYVRSQKSPAKAKTYATSFAKICQQLIELYALVP